MTAPTLPAILAVLAWPAIWHQAGTTPPAICAADQATCIVRSRSEVLWIANDGERVTISLLPDMVGRVAWNEALLRVADAASLQRDRAARAASEAARDQRLKGAATQ